MEDFLTALDEWWEEWGDEAEEGHGRLWVTLAWVQAGRPKSFPHPGGEHHSLGGLISQFSHDMRAKDGLPRRQPM